MGADVARPSFFCRFYGLGVVYGHLGLKILLCKDGTVRSSKEQWVNTGSRLGGGMR